MLLLEGHPSAVYALAFSPDGRVLLTGAKDGTILQWADGFEKPAPVAGFCGLAGPVNGLDFSPDGATLAIAEATGWVAHQALHDGKAQGLAVQAGGVTGVQFLTQNLLAVGHGSRIKPDPGTFELWDLSTGRRREPMFRAPHGVRAVAAHPPSQQVAWAEWGGRLQNGPRLFAWDITRADPIRFNLPYTAVSVAFHPDGQLLAAAQEWGVTVFDLARRQERFHKRGHKGQVTAVAFSPDGRALTTGSRDGTVRLWDPATGGDRGTFQWPIGKVMSLAYAPDGLRLAAGGDSGKVMVWDAD